MVSAVGCTEAPAWLTDAISSGILVRGATLSNVFVVPASEFESGPPEVFGDAFARSWWVAGKLSGSGVQPEVGVWLTNRTSADAIGEILSANATAQRYTNWDGDPAQPIRGRGLAEAIACVGPLPKS